MDEFIVKVKKLREEVESLYIYGAGVYGQTMYKTLVKNDIKVDGFTVTAAKNKSILGMPIFEIKDIIGGNIGIVLGLNKFNTIEVLEHLEQIKFDMDKVIYRKEFVRYTEKGSALNENPMIEITTRIGCKVDCFYCPQSLLLDSYFKDNIQRKKMFDIDDFKKCLDKLPLNCDVAFCGMAEPLLNPQCIDMMRLACDTGRTVELYTTLVGGGGIRDVEKICTLPLNLVKLHVADKFGHAKIPVSEEYYEMVKMLINARRKDGVSLVNHCSAQGEADDRIKEICEGKCEIVTVLHDRAGNLQGKNLIKQEWLSGKISCSLCSRKMNSNILLPDGTVLLCCMDYGMKHPLGNLLTDTYDEIMNGDAMKKVRCGVDGDETVDILCRNCPQAHNV